MSDYRIIFKKYDNRYYCQRKTKYKSWFGLGKEKTYYETLQVWLEASLYPPYDCGRYIDDGYLSLDEAEKALKKWIDFNNKKPIEIVYEE